MEVHLCERLHWEGMTKSPTCLRSRNYTNLQLRNPCFLMRTLEKSVRSLLHHQRRGIHAVHLFPPVTGHHYSNPLAAEGPVYPGLCGESATRSLQYQSTSWTPPIVQAIIGAVALRIPLHICVLVQRHNCSSDALEDPERLVLRWRTSRLRRSRTQVGCHPLSQCSPVRKGDPTADSEPNSESSMIAAVESFKRAFLDWVQQIRCLRLVITRFCLPEAR
jgi:hypothetical protein